MAEFTEELGGWLQSYAKIFDFPILILLIVAFLVVGIIGHFLILHAFRHLRVVTGRTRMPWDNMAVDALFKPVKWGMWLLLIYLFLGLIDSTDKFQSWLSQIMNSALILLLGWSVQRGLNGVEKELLGENRGLLDSDNRAAITATVRLLRICLYAVILLMILQSIGVSIHGLLTFGGVGGIVVGFAARDLLANFLGGLSIYLDRPFTVGDWIRSPDRDIEGTVEKIGWRITCIRTFDQRPLYVPNSVFSSVTVENPSRMYNRRIYETIGIRYDDISHMAGIVNDVKVMLQSHEAMDTKRRTLIVNFVSCGPSSLDFFIYTFTKTTNWVEFHAIKQDILLKVLAIIKNHGAEVAFPTQTLHIGNDGVVTTELEEGSKVVASSVVPEP